MIKKFNKILNRRIVNEYSNKRVIKIIISSIILNISSCVNKI